MTRNLRTSRIIANAGKGNSVDEIYLHALKLLQRRDYTVAQLSQKLETKFGSVPEDVIVQLLQKKFLDDRRFAENYVSRRRNRGATILREELAARGVPASLAERSEERRVGKECRS